MLCPRCRFDEPLVRGRCARCGYLVGGKSTLTLSAGAGAPPQTASKPGLYVPMRGDSLGDGRYRLVSQISLPETQQKQGLAWSAMDTIASHRSVVIREMLVPKELARSSSVDFLYEAVAQRLKRLGQHAGFPGVSDFFQEKSSYFIVFLYPEGASLSSLLVRHGGALPEAQIAEYGYQVCGLLTVLAEQQPPLVHGSINPDTVIVNEEHQSVSLIHLPLFPPEPPPSSSGQVSAGYYAPEQVRGETNLSTDLYGLAVTMHHVVTGYDPRTRLALFHPPARRLNPAVSSQMEMILARQLSLSASQRYARPSEMQEDLASLIRASSDIASNNMTGHDIDPLQLSSTQLRDRSRSVVMLNMGVFAAICILLLLGIFFATMR